MGRNYDITTFNGKYIFLRKYRVANFADIIKIATMLIKTTFEDLKNLK